MGEDLSDQDEGGRGRRGAVERSRKDDRKSSHKDRSRSRSRTRDKKKRRSRSRSRDKKKKRSRSRSREKKKKRSRSRDRKRSRSRSRDKKKKKDKEKDKEFDQFGAGKVTGVFGSDVQGLMPGTMVGSIPSTLTVGMDGKMPCSQPSLHMGMHGVGVVSGSSMAGISASSTPSATSTMPLALPGMISVPVPGRSDLVMVPGGKVITVAKQKQEMERATLNARRLYVGNVPAASTKEQLMEFLNGELKRLGAVPHHADDSSNPVVDSFVNEKGFSFCECATLEDVDAIIALDGIEFMGSNIKMRRPKDYQPENNPLVQMGKAEEVMRTMRRRVVWDHVADSPTKLYLGNVHRDVSCVEVREIICSFGMLRSFYVDVDARGRPRNGVWWEYYDPSVCERARQGLTGLLIKNQRVICMYATPGAPQPSPEDARPGSGDMTEPPTAPCTYEVPEAMDSFLVPSRVLELHNILVPGMNDEEVVEVEEDVKLECLSFGNVLSTHIAGPAQSLLGDGTAAAALEKSEDENKDGDEGNTSHDTDDDVDEDIIAEDKSGTSAKGMKDEMGRKSSQGNTNKKLNKKKDKTKYWGNVYIEFARPETATLAALQFSLRKYDERAVGVKFIPLSEYQEAFGKGIPPQTYEEKQQAALAAQEHLSNAIPETSQNPRLPSGTTGKFLNE